MTADKQRVLFSGYGVRMIDDLMGHISDNFRAEKCEARESEFEKAVKNFRPHVIVVCLQDEQRDDMRTYNILLHESEYVNQQVLVIGKDEDCELFKKKVVLKYCSILERPVKMVAFVPTLAKMAKDSLALMKWDEPNEVGEEKMEIKAPVGRRQSILVVDDDIRMLNVIKMYLEDLYDVTVVPSGKLALKFLEKRHADLVLLDYMMPEMNGTQVLEQIRTNSTHSNVPVLFLTGVSDKDLVVKSLKFNPNGYLLKPVTLEALLERVTEILLGL